MKTTKYLELQNHKAVQMYQVKYWIRNTWEDPALYDIKAAELAAKFKANFAKFEEFANAEIMAGAPNLSYY
jgi:ATP-dependent phosphoenolpyruvate carboxykinase